jgi:hypothetical protein
VINVEKVSNGYIVRGKLNGTPTTWVAKTEQELLGIINNQCDK